MAEQIQDNAISLAYERARIMAREGKSHEEIQSTLKQQGLNDVGVRLVISTLQQSAATRNDDNGRNDIIAGALWLGAGLAVSAVTYSLVAENGIYIVSFGALIYGAVRLIIGIVKAVNTAQKLH